ncbi:MAG: cation:proton antiporter [Candidatus Baldrarchaeia archaeon]
MAVQLELAINLYMYGVALLAGLLVAELSKRLHQSEVVGQILVGIVLGPYVLGILRPNEVFEFLSMIGMLTLLFIAGLETDIGAIMRSGIAAAVLTVSGTLFTITLTLPIVYLIAKDLAIAFYVGAALCATSISITVRVFTDFEKLKSDEAQTIVVAAVLDDLLSVILLSLVIDLVTAGTLTVKRIFRVLSLTGVFFLAILLFGVFFTKYIASKIWRLKSRGAMLIFCFSLALLVSFIAAYIGLSPIVGAYFAGVILAETEIRNNVLTEVSPIALVTVPIFLINIGMKISLVSPGTAVLIGILFSAVVVLSRFLGGVLTGAVQKQGKDSSYILWAGMLPRGEVLLIFADLGLTLGIIDNTWYMALILVVLVTTFLTPIFLKYLLLRGGKKDEQSNKDNFEGNSGKPG